LRIKNICLSIFFRLSPRIYLYDMKNVRSILYTWLLLFTMVSVSSCQKEITAEAVAQPQEKHLVSFKLKSYLPASTIRSIAAANGYPEFATEVKYDIVVFSAVYTTTYQGREIQASGLMCFPRNMETAPAVLSAQHGTLFAHKDAPSNFPSSFNGPELFASVGYATFIPDYIGYGVSSQILHPYYNAAYSANAVIDMLKAGREFCQQEDIPLSNKLFLAGYSEGGYVTLAAQKALEANPLPGLNLTAVAAGAGGYDLVSMLGNISTTPVYSNPSYLAFLTQAFNTANNWNRPTTDFFQEPYATKIPALLDGSKTGGDINKELPKQPNQLFSSAFFSALSGAGETQFKGALVANSLTNYIPQTVTRLYHGTADEVVPFSNSQATFDKLKANGAKNITFTPIPNATHGTGFQPMLVDLLPWFNNLR
jgi:pimeloyl-ACP methyl ester carboxylesterase